MDKSYPIVEKSEFTEENNTCSTPKKQNYDLNTSSLVESNQYFYNTKDNKKRKSELFIVKANINGLMENDNFNLRTENSSKQSKSKIFLILKHNIIYELIRIMNSYYTISYYY